MKTSGVVFTAVFLACIHASQPAHAASSSAVIKVSATVLPYMKLHAHQRVALYQVTAVDLERGYVDIPDSATVRIRTNENKTVGVTVSNEGPERILVREAGSAAFHGTDGPLVIGRPQKGIDITRNLDFRLILPKGAKEGLHTLNIAINPHSF